MQKEPEAWNDWLQKPPEFPEKIKNAQLNMKGFISDFLQALLYDEPIQLIQVIRLLKSVLSETQNLVNSNFYAIQELIAWQYSIQTNEHCLSSSWHSFLYQQTPGKR